MDRNIPINDLAFVELVPPSMFEACNYFSDRLLSFLFWLSFYCVFWAQNPDLSPKKFSHDFFYFF